MGRQDRVFSQFYLFKIPIQIEEVLSNNFFITQIYFSKKYEYEEEMEKSYRASLVKSFKKQIDDGYFSMILVDCINDKTDHYQPIWSYAKQKGFEVSTFTHNQAKYKQIMSKCFS